MWTPPTRCPTEPRSTLSVTPMPQNADHRLVEKLVSSPETSASAGVRAKCLQADAEQEDVVERRDEEDEQEARTGREQPERREAEPNRGRRRSTAGGGRRRWCLLLRSMPSAFLGRGRRREATAEGRRRGRPSAGCAHVETDALTSSAAFTYSVRFAIGRSNHEPCAPVDTGGANAVGIVERERLDQLLVLDQRLHAVLLRGAVLVGVRQPGADGRRVGGRDGRRRAARHLGVGREHEPADPGQAPLARPHVLDRDALHLRVVLDLPVARPATRRRRRCCR